MKLKYLVSGIIFLLIIGGASYKVYERQFVSEFVLTLNSSVQNELQLLSEKTPLEESVNEKFTLYKAINEKTKYSDTATISSGIIQATNIVLDKNNEYNHEITDNLEKVRKLKSKTNILLGKVRLITSDILNTAESFYTAEIEAEKKGKANAEASNVIMAILQDYSLSLQHSALITKYTINNPIDISSLEKYSRSDWTFNNKDEIKAYYPYTYEIITRYKNYLGGYYLLYKDIVKQNYESAAYKATKFTDSYTDLSVDWSRFGSEDKEKDITDTKSRLESAFKLNLLFYSFNTQRVGRYPFSSEARFVMSDPLLCNLYVVKTGLYQSIKYEYPKAKSFDELLTDLSTISPKTDELDRLFDKNSVEYSNNDKNISFKCKDKQLNRDYSFVIEK